MKMLFAHGRIYGAAMNGTISFKEYILAIERYFQPDCISELRRQHSGTLSSKVIDEFVAAPVVINPSKLEPDEVLFYAARLQLILDQNNELQPYIEDEITKECQVTEKEFRKYKLLKDLILN